MRICFVIALSVSCACFAFACSTEPSVHVPPDAPIPSCAEVPACAHTLCRIDDPPGYCTCDGTLCMKGARAE